MVHSYQNITELELSRNWGEMEGTTFVSGFPDKDRMDTQCGLLSKIFE